MIAQALFIKSEIDGWRSSNVWGTLIWQLNEVVSYAIMTLLSHAIHARTDTGVLRVI